jgi:hypothetical protein
MGFTTESLHSYVERDIKKEFSPREGWTIEKNPVWNEVAFDYQIWRKRLGKANRFVVDVMIRTKVGSGDVAAIQEKIDMLRADNVPVDNAIVVVPTGADVTEVPEEIEVKFLKILKIEDGDILWWRKNPDH